MLEVVNAILSESPEAAEICDPLIRRALRNVAQGNLNMTGEAYTQWTVDSYAWDWIAEQLNLTIIGDYVPPTPEPIVEAPIVEENIEEAI